MLYRPERLRRLDRIADMLCESGPSAALIARTADICERVFSSRESQRIKKLIHAGAWTDAALALLAMELPAWTLRRLIYDEGEWHCAISHQRDLPEWLDDAIEMHHTDMATAILKTLIEGLRVADDERQRTKIPRIPFNTENLVSCDNFS